MTGTMIEMTANINNYAGIHCRPSAVIVKSMLDYEGKITIANELGKADLKSVMGLMTLALRKDDKVTVMVEGPDENKTCETIVGLLETHFDFPPRADETLSDAQRPSS